MHLSCLCSGVSSLCCYVIEAFPGHNQLLFDDTCSHNRKFYVFANICYQAFVILVKMTRITKD